MAMNLTMYGYSKCGTCRNALKWLQANGHQVTMHDLFEQAPSAEVVRDWLTKSGLEIEKLFNTSGELYKELKLKDRVKAMTVEEKVELLASHGRLVKRPIVTDGNRVTVGFKAELFAQDWGL